MTVRIPTELGESSKDLQGPPLRRSAGGRREKKAATGFLLAVLVSVCLPLGVVISLWVNLSTPFWFNEQWRAYYIAMPNHWWSALKADGAPFPAGWYFLERASAFLFGSTELALRLPTALFLPVTSLMLFLLATRWMPLWAALGVSLVGSLTGGIVSYAVQLSEYQIDAAAAVAVILLHEIATSSLPSGRAYHHADWAYAGIAVACILSTPTIFLAGPLLLLDAVRLVQQRVVARQLVVVVVSGGLILLHLGTFVIRQSALTKSTYWDAQFLPHSGLGRQVKFVLDGLKGFLLKPFTHSPHSSIPALLSSRWSWGLSICFGILFALGVVQAARSQRGRAILLALGGSLVLTLVASYLRYWPFGFVRTNLYLVPILILVAGIGASHTVSTALGWSAGSGIHSARPLWVLPGIFAGLITLLTLTGFGFAATYEISSYGQLRDSAKGVAYGNAIGSAVDTVAAKATRDDVLLVAGFMAIQGWQYYQSEDTGSPSRNEAIPGSHVLYLADHGSPSITRMIDRFHPTKVFIYIPDGTTSQDLQLDSKAVTAAEPCETASAQQFLGSGLLVTLVCHVPNRLPGMFP